MNALFGAAGGAAVGGIASKLSKGVQPPKPRVSPPPASGAPRPPPVRMGLGGRRADPAQAEIDQLRYLNETDTLDTAAGKVSVQFEVSRRNGVQGEDRKVFLLDGKRVGINTLVSKIKEANANRPAQNGFGGKSLPMDEPSRMQRAREQGFDVDTPLYHGTTKDFDQFAPSKDGALGEGIYLTKNPSFAGQYARGDNANIRPVYARGPRASESEWFDLFTEVSGQLPPSATVADIDAKVIPILKSRGYTGIESDTAIVVFDPSNIRGKFAKFDPSETQSSKLLAGVSGSPEAIGAAGGTAIGMATAPDQNGDGVVDAQERMLGGAGGALTGGIAGGIGRNLASRRVSPPKPRTGPPSLKPPPSRMGVGAAQQAEERGPMFYSALSRAVEKSPTTKAPAAQWKATIANSPGVKAEEIEWTGINDWLDMQTGPVTKQQVAEYLDGNGVKIEETVRGVPDGGKANFRQEHLQRELLPLIEERDALINRSTASGQEWDELFNNPDNARIGELTQEIDRLQASLNRLNKSRADESTLPTKWSSYTLPGGENYRELLIKLPEAPHVKPKRIEDLSEQQLRDFISYNDSDADLDGMPTSELRQMINGMDLTQSDFEDFVARGMKIRAPESYRSSHWDEPNVLAHIRFSERMAGNRKVLAIEEIQSDWHQTGRDKGYKTPFKGKVNLKPVRNEDGSVNYWEGFDDSGALVGRETGRMSEAEARAQMQRYFDMGSKGQVPNAPFKNNAWAALSLKRMIRWAAENGFDEIAWVPGQVPVERFDLAKQIDELWYDAAPDGTYRLSPSKNGKAIGEEIKATDDTLDQYVGKELADKIRNRQGKQYEDDPTTYSLRGLDLKVGGEGMRAFYDNILINEANKLGKKYGAKVGQTSLNLNMMGGHKGFEVRPTNGKWGVYDLENKEWGNTGMTQEVAQRQAADLNSGVRKDQGFHSLPITPELKKRALGGQALMSFGGRTGRGIADNLKQDAALAGFGSVGGSFANQEDPQAGALGGMGIALGAKYGGRGARAIGNRLGGAGGVKPPPRARSQGIGSGRKPSPELIGGTPEARQRGIDMGFDMDRPLYHGTTHDFDQFDGKINNLESHHGGAAYFSTSPDDVARNYAGTTGADLTQRIELDAERMVYDIEQAIDGEDFDQLAKLGVKTDDLDAIDPMEEARRIVRQRIQGKHEGATLPVFARLKKPVITNGYDAMRRGGSSYKTMGEHKPTRWDFETVWDDAGEEVIREGGPAADLVASVERQYADIGADSSGVTLKLWNEIGNNEGIDADAFERIMRSEGADVIDYESSPGQIIQQVYRDLGHDGVILKNAERQFANMGMKPGTEHYVVFDPKNIRGKFAKFDPDKSDSPIIMNSFAGGKAESRPKGPPSGNRLDDSAGVGQSGGMGLSNDQKKAIIGALRPQGSSIYSSANPKKLVNSLIVAGRLPEAARFDAVDFVITTRTKHADRWNTRPRQGADPLEIAGGNRNWRLENYKKQLAADAALDTPIASAWREDFRKRFKAASAVDAQYAEAEAMRATVEAIVRNARKRGYNIRHVSSGRDGRNTSQYIVIPQERGGGQIRVSNHELPETDARFFAAMEGRGPRWKGDIVVSDWRESSIDDYLRRIEEIVDFNSPSKSAPAPALKSGGGSVQGPTTSVPVTRRPPAQAGFGPATRRRPPPPPQGAKGPPGTLSRMVAGGAIGGIAGGVAGEADPQTVETAQKIADNKAQQEVLRADIKKLEADKGFFRDAEITEIQKRLKREGKNIGNTGPNRDGVDGINKGLTQKGIEEFKAQIEADLERAYKRRTDLEKVGTDLDERAAFEDEEAPEWKKVGRELAPWIGVAAGMAIGYRGRAGAVKKAIPAAQKSANEANALLTPGPVSAGRTNASRAALKRQYANINEFWIKGGAGDQVPFELKANGEYKARPKKDVMPPSELFKSHRFRAGDAVVMAMAAGETGLSTVAIHFAEGELKAAQQAVDDQATPAAVKRLETARDNLALLQLAQRAGAAVLATRLAGSFKNKYPSVRGTIPGVKAKGSKVVGPDVPGADVAGADTERALLLEYLKK